MFAKRYSPKELIDILAAPSYSPEIIEYVKKVEKEPLLSQFLAQKPKLGITGSIAKDYVTKEHDDAVPYVSTKQVKGLHAYIDDAKYISKEADIEWANCRVEDGSIIINKSGNVGAAAVLCCSPYQYANSVSDIINIKLLQNVTIDRDYLVVYLNSTYGQKQLQRLSGGAIFSHVSLHAISDIHVYHAKFSAQKYIGDKVRQAEQLHPWAKYTQTNANNLIPAYINEIERYQHKSYRTVKLNPERLDSLFYHPDYIALESKMKSKGCKNLGLIATLIKQAWDKRRADNFEYFEIGGLDIGTGQVASENTETSSAPSRAKTKVQQGDVLVSTVRPNRKNVGFIIENSNDVEMVATSGFSVLRFSSLKEAAFYHAWLRTDDATSQLMRWNSGSAYPAIDDNVPLNIIVPEFDKDFIDEWGQKLLDAQFAYVYAKQLTNAAKTLVEALIEGQLNEEQLKQAQQALEDGDNTLDKAILSKLSSEGYAVEGATPLFSDVDELYRLLASATTADSED